MASSDIIKQEHPCASAEGGGQGDEETGAARREEPDLFPDFLVEPRLM